MVKDVLLLMIAVLCQMKKFCSALALFLQFDCFLRPNEVCSLKREDIAFPGEGNLGMFINCGVVLLRDTKTGPMQIVELRDPLLIRLLRTLIIEKDVGEKLFPSYRVLSSNFQEAMRKLGIDGVGYSLHSLRHGAATQEFLNKGFGSLAEIMHRGRWQSATVKKYLQGGAALLVHSCLPKWIFREAEEIKDHIEELFLDIHDQ